jgi:hypothetical protein
MISAFKAQIAFLIQISLVLSVTETSIIFITPIHHTSNEIDPIAASKYVKIHIALSIASEMADRDVTENPAKSICLTLYFLIRKYLILFTHSSALSSYERTTVIVQIFVFESILFWYVVIGIYT